MRKKIRSVLSIVLALVLVIAPLSVTVQAATPVGFKVTSIEQSFVSQGHLMVNIDKNLTTLGMTVQGNGWSATHTVVPCHAGTSKANATARNANAYSIWGTQILFESFFTQNPDITYVKVEKASCIL